MKFIIIFILIISESLAKGTIKGSQQNGDVYFLEIPFFRLPTMKISVIKGGRLAAYLYVQFDMKAIGKEAYDKAKILMPRLTDAVFRDLYSALHDRWNVNDKLSASTLSERALKIVNRVFEKDEVEGVFIKEFFVAKH